MAAARPVGLCLTPLCCRGCVRFGLTLTFLLHAFVVPQQSLHRLVRIDRAKGAVPVVVDPLRPLSLRYRVCICRLIHVGVQYLRQRGHMASL
jgi:hypothetical protein